MKKITYLLFIGSLATMLTTSCGNKTNSLVAKKWVFKEIEKKDLDEVVAVQMQAMKDAMADITDAERRAEAEERFKTTAPKVSEEIINQMKGMMMNFKSDGTCEISVAGEIETGTWGVSEDQKKITLTEGSKKKELEITKLTDDELIWNMKDTGRDIHIKFSPGK